MHLPGSETLEIVGPALAAGLMIALTHAPLGIEVLRRGIIFIDLAIAQVAGLGLVLANVYWPEAPAYGVQLAALAGALLAAGGFRMVERYLPDEQEPIIGCAFVLAASCALLVLADQPHGGEEIQHLLSGQMLFVTWQDVAMHAPVYGAILALWFLWPHIRRGSLFFAAFACAITSSVQLVGVYVVFASLILPALATRPLTGSRQPLWAMCCGLLGVFLGIVAALLLDVPAGPVLVLMYAAVAGVLRMALLKGGN
ncbi:MAG: metal ABC transporter permease [Proteobacteria bacterium]|nr:metal ABC transporter permease [Pseudomonadota bacterium]